MFETAYKAIKRKTLSIGFLPTIKLIINHLITKIFYREYLLFYVDIPGYSFNPEEIGKHIIGKEIRCFTDLSSKDIGSIRDYAGKNYIQETKRRLSNNWILFIAYMNDELVGAAWALTNTSDLKIKIVPLLEGDIVIINCWTLPSFRGRNIYPFLLSLVAKHFEERNFKRAFVYANERNIPSIMGIKKAGYKHFINYKTYNLFRNEVVIWKPLSKRGISNP
jgi:RimJ/RimL family protein N-acetyltransferase